MRFRVCLLLPWLFGSNALATPRLVPRSKGFTVTTTKSGRRDFRQEMAAVRRKWGTGNFDNPASLAHEDDIVEARPNERDSLFIADVEIGDPPQTVKLAMDTGSADVWTQSSDTIYLWNQEGPWAPQYRANMSKSAHRVAGAEWKVGYVDGSAAQGIVYLDKLRLGNFEVSDMAIESAKYITRTMEADSSFSGIMGLAKSLPSRIIPSTPTFIERLRPLLERPVFSVDLRRDATGYFEFGHIDEQKALGNITWVDSLPDSNHWDIFLDLTRWEGSLNNPWHKYPFNATIDTGTTLLYLPPTLATAYWYDVPTMRIDPRVDDAFTFKCDIADKLPDLMFKLPGTEHQLRIPGHYLNFGPVDYTEEYCWGGMQSAEGLSTILIGDTALKALYVVFDLETHRVGLANKRLDID